MTDINWPEAFAYYSARLADMWPGKVAVGTALSSLCLLLGMDEVLFYVLLAKLTGEMLSMPRACAVACNTGLPAISATVSFCLWPWPCRWLSSGPWGWACPLWTYSWPT